MYVGHRIIDLLVIIPHDMNLILELALILHYRVRVRVYIVYLYSAVGLNKLSVGDCEDEENFKLCFLPRDSASEQKEFLQVRQFMDRRRLEEGFLLFIALEVKVEYDLALENIPYDKTELSRIIVQQYEDVFYKKWTGMCINYLTVDTYKIMTFLLILPAIKNLYQYYSYFKILYGVSVSVNECSLRIFCVC